MLDEGPSQLRTRHSLALTGAVLGRSVRWNRGRLLGGQAAPPARGQPVGGLAEEAEWIRGQDTGSAQ